MIQCKDCSGAVESEQTVARTVPIEVERFLNSQLKSFKTLSPSHRSIMSSNFPSFTNHTKFFNANYAAKLWLTHFRDESSEVRSNVGKTIVAVMRNKTKLQQKYHETSNDLKEFEKLVIGNLVEALDHALEAHDLDLHLLILKTAQEITK